MAIIFRLQWAKRVGTSAEKAERTYVASYLAESDDKFTSEVTVLTHPNCPKVYSVYVGADGNFDPKVALARTVVANQREDSPYFWDVVVTYSNRFGDPQRGDPKKNDPDPVARRPTTSWSNTVQSLVVMADLAGNPIVNSAGEKFADPPEENEIIQTYHVTRTEDVDPNPILGAAFVGSVNSKPFKSWPPGYAKCTKLDSKERYENNRYYFDTEYEIQCKSPYRAYGWQPRILDDGMHTRNKATGKPENIVDTVHGGFITSSVLLDGDGQLLSKASAFLQGPIGPTDTQLVILQPVPSWMTDATLPFTATIGVTAADVFGTLQEIVQFTTVDASGGCTVVRAFGSSFASSHKAGAEIAAPPVWLTFQTLPSVDFDLLNLP